MLKNLLKLAAMIILSAAVSIFIAPCSGSAQTEGAPSDNLAIVLLVDTSGSMRYTDPEKLRETAAFLFIDLLNPADYLSVITFNQDVEVVVPLQAIGSASQKSLVQEKLGAQLEPGGDTDYRAALLAANDQLEGAAAAGLRPVVILLTDGEPNPDTRHRHDRAFMDTYLDSLWETITRFTLSNRPVYTIAFSDEVNPAVIERISMLTRGEHYLLDNPRELLFTFYELLETIKNRQRVTEASFSLQDSIQSFTFTVKRQTVQANLIIENREGTDFTITVQPPQSAQGQKGNPVISRGPGYGLVVFHEPGAAMLGEWEVSVSGSGSFRVLGNADYPLKAWIVEPAYGVMLPFSEPIPMCVRLTGVAAGSLSPPEVFVQFASEGRIQTEWVPLTADGEYYRGIHEGLHQPGIYEMRVSVLSDQEPVAETSSRIYLKNIPQLVVNTRLLEQYRFGEKLKLEASLLLGGHRLHEGSDFALEHFNFVLTYSEGTRLVYPFHDSGDHDHGDFQVSDGIWSNRFAFEREGEAEAALLVVGRYNGEEFVLEKKLGSISVRQPGHIALRLDRADLYAAPGRTMYVPVTIENRSAFEETLLINAGDVSFRVLEPQIALAPGEIKSVNLRVAVSSSQDTGVNALPLSFSAGTPLTAVEPLSFNPDVEIVSPALYFWYRLAALKLLLPAPLKLFLLSGLLFYGLGLLLYHLCVCPREKLGKLVYWKEGPRAGQTVAWGKFTLSRVRGHRAVISFNTIEEADFTIEGSAYCHKLVFSVERIVRGPLFMLGWLAALRPRLASSKITVACTPPGVIEAGGAISTCLELRHGDEFQSGDYYFKYLETAGRVAAQKEGGVNILEGRI